MSKSSALATTVTEYSEASSIHGVSYIFNRRNEGPARFVWLIIVIIFAGLGIHSSSEVKMDTCILWQHCFAPTINQSFKRDLLMKLHKVLTGKYGFLQT
jgi:uncharacterized protein (DUF983 family)